MTLPRSFVAAAILFGAFASPAMQAEAMPAQSLAPIVAPAAGVQQVYYRYYGYPGYRWRRPFYRPFYGYGFRRPFYGRGYYGFRGGYGYRGGYSGRRYGGARPLIGSRAR